MCCLFDVTHVADVSSELHMKTEPLFVLSLMLLSDQVRIKLGICPEDSEAYRHVFLLFYYTRNKQSQQSSAEAVTLHGSFKSEGTSLGQEMTRHPTTTTAAVNSSLPFPIRHGSRGSVFPTFLNMDLRTLSPSTPTFIFHPLPPGSPEFFVLPPPVRWLPAAASQ